MAVPVIPTSSKQHSVAVSQSPFDRTITPEALRAISGSSRTPFWLDSPDRPDACAPLAERVTADLVVVGGGLAGLWTALLAAEQGLDVVLLEADRIGSGAAGRNGGFLSPSITHGFNNGMERWPNEMPQLLRLGHENVAQTHDQLAKYGIDAGLRRAGELDAAITRAQADGLREEVKHAAAMGEPVRYLEGAELRSLVNSPLYVGASLDESVHLVNPARLAWGLRTAFLSLGGRIFENSPAEHMTTTAKGVEVGTPLGVVQAQRAALLTGAFQPLLKRMSQYVIPVYDYVLVTQPLTSSQWVELGWDGREGISDTFNQFHYFRPTDDGRILWGGYDAIPSTDGVHAGHDQRPESFAVLAEHLYRTFPAIRGIEFSHRWGGAIDTCTRFSPFWGLANKGRVGYVAGFTGLGVGASRFAAATLLDMLAGRKTERTELEMVRSKPMPFPPQPFKGIGIGLTRWSLDRADKSGRRNFWLRSLDRVGLGFDS
jgi:glycine/D-amino acid oxidase-like deaminating enzyme